MSTSDDALHPLVPVLIGAAADDNPTIMSALSALLVAAGLSLSMPSIERLIEGTQCANRTGLDLRRLVVDLVDLALTSRDPHALAAMDNFIDVAIRIPKP